MLAYWENEEKLSHYFLFQILFEELIKRPEFQKFSCTGTNDIDTHRLQEAFTRPYNEQEWNFITSQTSIHKLTPLRKYAENSFYAKVLSLRQKPHEIQFDNKRDDITFCTMLFNMGKGRIEEIKKQDRKFEEFYLESLKRLSSLFPKLVLWCDAETANFIDSQHLPIRKKITKFNELPRYEKHSQYVEYIREMQEKCFKKESFFINRNPKTLANYIILMLAKMDILKWAIEEDFFCSDYFVWIDAGITNKLYERCWRNWDGVVTEKPKVAKMVYMTHRKKIRSSEIETTAGLDIVLNRAPFEVIGGVFMVNKASFPIFYEAFSKTVSGLESQRLITHEMCIFSLMLHNGEASFFDLARTRNYVDAINLALKKDSRENVCNDVFRKRIALLLCKLFSFIKNARFQNYMTRRFIYRSSW
jgi:hypothetical protein